MFFYSRLIILSQSLELGNQRKPHTATLSGYATATRPTWLANIRAPGTDESLVLARIQKMTLEQALEFIAEALHHFEISIFPML